MYAGRTYARATTGGTAPGRADGSLSGGSEGIKSGWRWRSDADDAGECVCVCGGRGVCVCEGKYQEETAYKTGIAAGVCSTYTLSSTAIRICQEHEGTQQEQVQRNPSLCSKILHLASALTPGLF